jgi:phosphatidylserine decarboxylase
MSIKIGFVPTPHSTTQPDFRTILNTLANPVLAPQVDHVGMVTLVIWGANDLPDWPTGDLFVPSNAPSLLTRSQVTRIGWDMDPYVKVTVGDEVQCTQVIRHERNPIWDKQLVFHVRESELSFPILLSVFDWDRVSFDDHVGDVQINISQLIPTTSRNTRTTEFFSDDLPTMSEFRNVPLTLNPKRSYKCVPTLTFR